ncbi:MAG TPA: hypothetical protein VGO40_10120 [Longimicrobium sp.]|jgi:hypothetical protein|nr:hypothetical protein [Longimicrobium sp.]
MRTVSRIFDAAFVRGMAQAMDLTGGIARRRLARFRTRRRGASGALGGDWSAVGRDLTLALQRYRELHGQ